MIKIISIPITYRDRQYYSLIRFNYKNDVTELNVTVMNGDIEKHLCNNNIFYFKNGYLIVDVPIDGSESSDIKLAVVEAIDSYLCEQRSASKIPVRTA